MKFNLRKREVGKNVLIVVFASIINVVALNDFLIPGKIFSAGINGIAQIVAMLLDTAGVHLSTGWFILLFNIPIGLLGWFKVGRSFTFYSILVALLTSILAIVMPVVNISDNPLLGALFGGILTGVARLDTPLR